MFYIGYLCFWSTLVIYPLTFGDPIYSTVLFYASYLQQIFLFICTASYIFKPKERQKSCLMFMGFYTIYAIFASFIFHEITSLYYALENIIILAMATWLLFRPDIKTARTINRDNILLAFYKGKRGSFIMNFFALFGYNVKSMCVLAGDKALYLKKNERTFIFGDSAKIYRKSKDYIIVDTGKPYDDKFITEMKKHSNTVATKCLFRIRCIEAISDLLGMIGEEFKPKSYIPSIYLRNI